MSKKRKLEEFNKENDDDFKGEPPSKKVKTDDNESKNERNILEQSIIDLKDGDNITMDKIKSLFSINTSNFKNRYDVYLHFCNLSLTLIRDLLLIVRNKNKNKLKMYQFVEFEFYCLDYNSHKDVFAHCDDLQLKTCSSWYFHRSGNNSAHGWKFMNDKENDQENANWTNPRPRAAFRSGTFKGLDITFGEENKHFGGILIRSIRELKENPIASTSSMLSPGDIIEGPCNTVNKILKDSGFEKIDHLTTANNFNLSIFGDGNNPIHVDLAKKYKIKQVAPIKKVEETEEDKLNGNNINYNKYFYNSPRVGLTMKNEKSLNGKELEIFQNIKVDYIMAPYRTIRRDCLSKLKKYKALIALSIVYNKYYYNKLNKIENESKHVQFQKAVDLGPFKHSKLQGLVKQYHIGQKNKETTIKDASSSKWKTNSNELCKLFGATGK